MNQTTKDIKQLLALISKAESIGLLKEADSAHNSLIKLAQQAQGNAYSFFDTSAIPPAISAILANLNYKVTQLDNTQKQMVQQMGGVTGKPPVNPQQNQQQGQNNQQQNQQYIDANQNPITPNTVNYVQTPGSTPAPIQVDGGEINV